MGPFIIGKNELDGDPVASFAGIRNLRRGPAYLSSKQRGKLTNHSTFFSELATGGVVDWRILRTGGGGEVPIQPSDVAWNSLVQTLSTTEVLLFAYCGIVVTISVLEH